MTEHSSTLNYFRANTERVCLAKGFSSLHNRKRHDDGRNFFADVQKEDHQIAKRLQTLDELPEIPLMFLQDTILIVRQKMNPPIAHPRLSTLATAWYTCICGKPDKQLPSTHDL